MNRVLTKSTEQTTTYDMASAQSVNRTSQQNDAYEEATPLYKTASDSTEAYARAEPRDDDDSYTYATPM